MGTHYKGSAEEKRVLDAYIRLIRCSESVTSRLQKLLKAHKLTVSQFGVLEAVYHLGPLSQTDLSQKLLKSGGNITTVIDNLENRSLVRRERDADDRRYFNIKLTAKGRNLIRRVFPKHLAGIVEEFKVLSKTETEELGELCRKLGIGGEE